MQGGTPTVLYSSSDQVYASIDLHYMCITRGWHTYMRLLPAALTLLGLAVQVCASGFANELQSLAAGGGENGLRLQGTLLVQAKSFPVEDYAAKCDDQGVDIMVEYSVNSPALMKFEDHRLVASPTLPFPVHSLVQFSANPLSHLHYIMFKPVKWIRWKRKMAQCHRVGVQDERRQFARDGAGQPKYSLAAVLLFGVTSEWAAAAAASEPAAVDGEPLHWWTTGCDLSTDCRIRVGLSGGGGGGGGSGDGDSLSDLRVVELTTAANDTMTYVVSSVSLPSWRYMRSSGVVQAHDGVSCPPPEDPPEEPASGIVWPPFMAYSAQHVFFKKGEMQAVFTREFRDLQLNVTRVDVRGGARLDGLEGQEEVINASSSIILHHELGVAFLFNQVLDMCLALPLTRLLTFGVHLMSDDQGGLMTEMSHLTTLTSGQWRFKGACESGTRQGQLFSLGDDEKNPIELCVQSPTPTNRFSTPLYLATYESKEKTLEMDQHTLFFDVEAHQGHSLHDSFDVSSCLRPEEASLLLVKMETSAPLALPEDQEVTLVWGGRYGGNVTMYNGGAHAADAMERTMTHAMAYSLASVLGQSPLRLSRVAFSEGGSGGVFVQLALLDFSKLHRSALPIRSNDYVINGVNLDQAHFNITFVPSCAACPSQSRSFMVTGIFEIDEDEWARISVNREAEGSRSGLAGSVALLLGSSMVAAVVGAGVGLGAAYRLWRASTSFGYMIHTDVY